MSDPAPLDTTSDATVADAADAIAAIVWGVQDLLDAKNVNDFAGTIDYLRNNIGGLASWHPDYNSDTGEIPREAD